MGFLGGLERDEMPAPIRDLNGRDRDPGGGVLDFGKTLDFFLAGHKGMIKPFFNILVGSLLESRPPDM